MTIQILPPRLANQIAAGEVVERPASVIKELVENSLDSGATRIEIEIDKGGHKRLLIRDNGKGIAKDELGLALSRHATSKIHSLEDLESILTMGFRGEALASISSVSRLTLTSKPAEQEQGWQAHCEGRDMDITVNPVGHPNGTSVEVLDLFFNTPARRKFLRTEKTEFTHIEETLKRIALSRQDVSFSLKHNGKLVKKYPAVSGGFEAASKKRVGAVCGQRFIDDAVWVSREYPGMSIRGWLAPPQSVRNQNDLQFFYVNDRVMRDKLIGHAIRQAYEGLIAPECHPAFVLYFNIDPIQVDVNVHPAKHEVRFHEARLVHDFIYSTLSEALNSCFSSDEIEFESSKDEQPRAAPPEQPIQPNHDYIVPLQTKPSEQSNYSGTPSSYSRPSPAPARGGEVSKEAARNYQNLMNPDTGASHGAGSGQMMQAMRLDDERLLLMLDQQCFLLSPSTLFAGMCEQNWQKGEVVSQPLLMPASVQVANDEKADIDTLIPALAGYGLQLVRNGGKLMLKQVPAAARKLNWVQVLNELLTSLRNTPPLPSEMKNVAIELLVGALKKGGKLPDDYYAASIAWFGKLDRSVQESILSEQATVIPLHDWVAKYD